jgi:hypothetical protein
LQDISDAVFMAPEKLEPGIKRPVESGLPEDQSTQ